MNKNIEVEGGEIAIRNSHGDLAIIPKNKRNWVKQKLSEGCHSCIDSLVETLPVASQYAQDGSVYPPNTKVKVNQDNQIKEYDISSNEYKDLYNSGKLMNYDENTDTYITKPLKEVTVTTEAPQWLKDKRNLEEQYTKDWYIDNILPKFSRSMGVSVDNMNPNNVEQYNEFINNKLAEGILKRNPKVGSSNNERLAWYNSLSEKEREIVNNSYSADKFSPAVRAYMESQSNEAKKYGILETFRDVDKLAQSVEGTPERFRIFPNAENNYENYVNPLMWIGYMAKGLGNVPKDIKEENYLKAASSVASPLLGGALGGLGAKTTGQFIKNIFLPLGGLEKNIVKGGKNLVGKLSKTDKVIDATKAGSKVLNKTDNVVNKVNRYLESPDPNNYYRVIGNKEGYDDLINSGIVRPNQSGIFKGRNTYYTKGNINDKFNPVISGGVKKNTIYDGEYIVEIKPNNLHFPTDNHGLHKKWNFGLTTAGNEIPYSSEYLNVYKYNTKVKKYELLDKFLNKTDDAVNNINRIKFDDFKNDNEFFRVIVGDEAFDDIVQTQKIRTKQPSSVKNTPPNTINLDRRGSTAFPSFSKGSPSLSYANDNPNHYIIRTADESIKPSTSGRHGKGTTMFPTDKSGKHLTELDASKVQVYRHVGNGEYELVNTAKPIISSVDDVVKNLPKVENLDKVSETVITENVVKAGFPNPLTLLTKPKTLIDNILGRNQLEKNTSNLYRKIGNKKGLKSLIENEGAISPGYDNVWFSKGSPNEDYNGVFAVELPSDKIGIGKNEISKGMGLRTGYKITNKNNIPIEDLKVYRRRFLSTAYKEIDKTKLANELKTANIQNYIEKLWKYGSQGYLLHEFLAHEFPKDFDKWTPKIEKFYKEKIKPANNSLDEYMWNLITKSK